MCGNVVLRRLGLNWYNPDSDARQLVQRRGMDQTVAHALAWQHGLDLLDLAVAAGRSHAFETTLGAATMLQRIAAASAMHDVLI